MKISIFGSNSNAEIYLAKEVALAVLSGQHMSMTDLHFESFLECDYLIKLSELQRETGGRFLTHTHMNVVLIDGEYVGNVQQFIEYSIAKYSIDKSEYDNMILYDRNAREDFQKCLSLLPQSRSIVYMDFADGSPHYDIDTPQYGKIIIELFDDIVPLASDNFKKLCTGECGANDYAKLHYMGCQVHSVIKNGWMCSGDIVNGSGSNSYAATGTDGYLQDESFTCDFGSDLGGMVGFTTSTSHTIGSQFFITLGDCNWMNGIYQGVGRVLVGFDVLKKIGDVETINQRPQRPITIADAGLHK